MADPTPVARAPQTCLFIPRSEDDIDSSRAAGSSLDGGLRNGGTRFFLALGVIVALGAAVHLLYVLTDDRPVILGDGYAYHFEANRFADGSVYTSALGDVGAPFAHHPPAWVTTLGIVSWFGARSFIAHQLVGVVIGLGIVLLAGLVGRQYFNARVGLWAAALAAVYPGFWVLEGQILSEPLTLLVLGVFMLECASLAEKPTFGLSALVGATCGLLALVRSEELLLLAIVIAPILLRARSLSLRQRWVRVAAAAVAAVVVIAPWALYNSARFKDPVFLSTNSGPTLLAGNCAPSTFRGELLGHFDVTCNRTLAITEGRGRDRSELDRLARDEALSNIAENFERVPFAIAARVGRLLAVYRPAQTVSLTADWFGSDDWPVWLWVVSFWGLGALAVMGVVIACRKHALLLPLLGPVALAIVVVLVMYGGPRFHAPADLCVVVLAAVALDRISAGVFQRFAVDQAGRSATGGAPCHAVSGK
jgi:4-amino-4-deoxy-L-arabinose transferase-like glycosyltransferase